MMISPWRSVRTCQPHALRTSPTPRRSHRCSARALAFMSTRFCPSDQYTSRHCWAPLSEAGSYPIRSHVLGVLVSVGSVHCCVYRPTKRPSNWGDVTIQCSIGDRYRIAETDWGPLGLLLTSRKLWQPPATTRQPASTSTWGLVMVRT